MSAILPKWRLVLGYALATIALLLAIEAARCWVQNTPALAWWIFPAAQRRLATVVGFAALASALAVTALSATPRRVPSWLLFLYVFALALTNGRYIGSGDCEPTRLLPFIALRQHQLTFEGAIAAQDLAKEYVVAGARIASKYPIATALLAIPAYLPAALGSYSPASEMPFELERIAAAMLAAFSLCLLRPVFRRFTASDTSALWVCGAYGFGTAFLTILSKALWQHTGAAFGLSLAMFGLFAAPKRASGVWVGIGAGLALACRPVDVILSAGVLLALFWIDKRQAVVAALLTFACALLVALYNLSIFGSVTSSGYGTEAGAFTASFVTGFAGLLISPARGLLLYTPCLALAALALVRADGMQVVTRTLLGACALFVMVMAKWWCWWGGYSPDSRMVCDTLPLLSVGLALAWTSTPRVWLLAACTWGVALHVLQAYVGGNAYVRALFWAMLEGPWDPRSFAPVTYVLGIFLHYPAS